MSSVLLAEFPVPIRDETPGQQTKIVVCWEKHLGQGVASGYAVDLITITEGEPIAQSRNLCEIEARGNGFAEKRRALQVAVNHCLKFWEAYANHT